MEPATSAVTNVALIGDGYVGKTCVLNCLQKLTYSKNSAPNVYNEMMLEATIKDRKIVFRIIDTAGQEEYDHIRREVYDKADIFILCFCIADKVSYENIITKWIPDLHQYKTKPIILLDELPESSCADKTPTQAMTAKPQGTKVDLRINSPSTSISRERGLRLQKRIGAKFYVECSSKSEEGISDIIDAASKILLINRHKKTCIIQ